MCIVQPPNDFSVCFFIVGDTSTVLSLLLLLIDPSLILQYRSKTHSNVKLRVENKELKQKQLDFEAEIEAACESSDETDGDESDSNYEDAEEGDWGMEWSGVQLKECSKRGSYHSMLYYMACIQSIMRATPEVVRYLQEASIEFMMKACPALKMADNWKDQLI